MTLSSTISGFLVGGANAYAGVGSTYQLAFTGVWAVGDTFLVTATEATSSVTVQYGDGFVTNIEPTFALVFKDQIYLLAGSTVYFCAIDNALVWNDINANGNGYMALTNYTAASEQLLSIAIFQGRLVFFSEQTAQSWIVDPDETKRQLLQVFENIGIAAPRSAKGLGDLDVLFFSNTGVRSFRVRDSSNNAFVVDIGSPVDQLLLDQMAVSNPSDAFSVVEPTSNRYWQYYNGQIYTLSLFQASKIQAWATYTPSYEDANGNQVRFTPTDFVVHSKQVYTRDDAAVYAYGGSDGNTYDMVQPIAELPWMDSKQPGDKKSYLGIDVVRTGQWEIQCGADPKSGKLQTVVLGQATADVDAMRDSTYAWGFHPYNAVGTHLKVRMIGSKTPKRLVVSALTVYFKESGERP